jgi:hypothetical protein
MTVSRRFIRSLFLEPKPSYPLPEAAKLLGMKAKRLQAWVEAGEIEGVYTCSGVVLPWEELASFAMEWWSQEAVEEALGREVAGVIPELLRLAELEVRIPRMEVVALERVAGREGKSVDAVLARELLDFVSANAEWLGEEVVGFGEAFVWPSRAAADAPSARS